MGIEKVDLKILKDVIFEIAETNGTTFSEIQKKKELTPETIKGQIVFLQNMGMLKLYNTGAGENAEYGEMLPLKLKPEIEVMQKIINIFDNRELFQFLQTKFYLENLKNYHAYITNLMKEQALLPLPDTEYFLYALKNSPTSVRYFLADNDKDTLKSFYLRCISATNEKLSDRRRLELMGQCHMYLIWESVLFSKIQDDKRDNNIVESVPYYTGYLPIAKKSFEKLLELYKMLEKEPEKNSNLRNYIKTLISNK